MRAPEALGGALGHERHADGKRQGDQPGWNLQDRRALGPTRGDKLNRDDPDQSGDEENHDVGERKADALDPCRDEVQDEADLRVIAPSIGDGAADERENRQDQPRDFVGPEKRFVEDEPRQNVGKHKKEFAEQSGDDDRFSRPVDGALSERLRSGAKAHRFGAGH